MIVLLGGEKGLRCGEMIAFEWKDVDLTTRQLCVHRSDWNGQVTSLKGGRLRYVRLTIRLTSAMREQRHLKSPRVLCEDDGTPLTRQKVQYRVKRAARKANVRDGVHILRHTFCSHLAMRGAAARAIQELAGHSELGVTQRYMHLTPAALDAAIRLLDGRGNIMATAAGLNRETGEEILERFGGEAGIRTLGRAFRPYNGLANRRLQPLGHLTAARKLSIYEIATYTPDDCPHDCP